MECGIFYFAPGPADPSAIYDGGALEPFDRPTGATTRYYALFTPNWAKCVVYASWGRVKQRFGQAVRGKGFELGRPAREWHGDLAESRAPLVVIA